MLDLPALGAYRTERHSRDLFRLAGELPEVLTPQNRGRIWASSMGLSCCVRADTDVLAVTAAAARLGAAALRDLANRIAAGWPDHAILGAGGQRSGEAVAPVLAARADIGVPDAEQPPTCVVWPPVISTPPARSPCRRCGADRAATRYRFAPPPRRSSK